MNATLHDPRSSQWGCDHPAYHVSVWQGLSNEVWRITDADVPEVIEFAEKNVPADGTFLIYVEMVTNDGIGIIRLMGTDPTEAGISNDPRQDF